MRPALPPLGHLGISGVQLRAGGGVGEPRPSLIQEPVPLKQHTGRTAQGLSRAAAGTTDLAGRPPDLAVQRECVVYHAQQRPRLPLLSACRSHKKRCCPKA